MNTAHLLSLANDYGEPLYLDACMDRDGKLQITASILPLPTEYPPGHMVLPGEVVTLDCRMHMPAREWSRNVLNSDPLLLLAMIGDPERTTRDMIVYSIRHTNALPRFLA